jgi:hypothetical protein
LPYYINEATGKVKNLLDNGVQRRKKQVSKSLVKEEIPMHMEKSNQGRIQSRKFNQGSWQMG